MNHSGIAAAILAGGKCTRMAGRQKALLQIDGVALIDRVLMSLRHVFDDITIVSNTPDFCSPCSNGCCVVPDSFRDIGPLGGLHAALSGNTSDAVFVCACDMPYLDPAIITDMVAAFRNTGGEVMLPRVGSFIEPLHAIYATTLTERLEKYLCNTQKYAIRHFISMLDVRYYYLSSRVSERIFRNVNTMQDLQRL